jgi:hypothetical protein
MLEVKKYFKEKKELIKAKKEARKEKKMERALKKYNDELEKQEKQKAKDNAGNWVEPNNENIMSIINSNATTQEKREAWYRVFLTGVDYNPDFSVELNNSFS